MPANTPAPRGPMCSENGILGYTNEEISAMTAPAPTVTDADVEAAERAISAYADPIIQLPFRVALVAQVAAALAQARAEGAEDRARVDWLENAKASLTYCAPGEHYTLEEVWLCGNEQGWTPRAAIDAMRKEGDGEAEG